MTTALPLALDLVAIAVLTFGLYFPRHRRRDLVVAYLGVNVGVLAVCMTLASSTIGAGLGLGLFGVLSIIRLRSTELGQNEVAYYFSALALGLLGGLANSSPWLTVGLMALVLAVVYVGDHPRLLPRYRSQLMNVDAAFTDHAALVAHLEGLLGARVHSASVQRLDLVLETTLVDVRYEVPAQRSADLTAGHAVTPVAR
jgi:ABC-type transport system involved in cytochrome c biogenesis permease subunit